MRRNKCALPDPYYYCDANRDVRLGHKAHINVSGPKVEAIIAWQKLRNYIMNPTVCSSRLFVPRLRDAVLPKTPNLIGRLARNIRHARSGCGVARHQQHKRALIRGVRRIARLSRLIHYFQEIRTRNIRSMQSRWN